MRCAKHKSKSSFRPFMNRGRFQVQKTVLCLPIEHQLEYVITLYSMTNICKIIHQKCGNSIFLDKIVHFTLSINSSNDISEFDMRISTISNIGGT